MFDLTHSHDACGVGFIASLDRAPTYRMTRLAVECLQRLDHRGAKAADGTGDGAGLLTQIPRRLISRELSAHGLDVNPDSLGIVMCFLSPTEASASRSVVSQAIEAEGLRLLFWRSVPTDPSVLGDHARDVLPLIEQAIVTGPGEPSDFERSLYLARKRIERAATPGLSIPSASCRTVVYKGLFTASSIDDFYWDLRDPDFETAFAIFHQRYSTNTFPSWSNAQPFRARRTMARSTPFSPTGPGWLAREKGTTRACGATACPTCSRSSSPGSPTRAAWTTPSSC